MKTQHTQESWKILPDCQRERGNPFDSTRFIATQDAEWSGDNRDGSDYLISGSLICEMRDGPPERTRLIAAAPELLSACQVALAACEIEFPGSTAGLLRAAIAKATA
jgi:hypothetical protein